MIECSLDGINLKILGVNGEDGKISLYQAETDDYIKSKVLLPELEIDAIAAKSTKDYKESGKKIRQNIENSLVI